METKKKKERSVIILLIVAILLMAIGFAAYSTSLNIKGNVTVKGKPWNVHYINGQIKESTGSVKATSATVNDTNFEFTVTLSKPGDFYEATITVQNEGTIDAILKSIDMSALTEAQQKYLKYTVTYNGTEYTASKTGLATALAAGGTHDVKVRVEYLSAAAQADLPTTDTTVTVTGTLNYADQ